MLGGSLCSEYLALQPEEEEEDDCETVMEDKCLSQNTTHCTTQLVKVTTLAGPLSQFPGLSSLLSEKLPDQKPESVPGGGWEVCEKSREM